MAKKVAQNRTVVLTGITEGQKKILIAASKLAAEDPNGMVCMKKLRSRIKLGCGTINGYVSRLRAENKWPFETYRGRKSHNKSVTLTIPA